MVSKFNLRPICIYILKSFFIFLYLYNLFFRLKNRRKYLSEINERKNLSLFDYKELSKPLPYYPIEQTKDSNYYGYSYYIKKYAQCKEFPYSIEHGLYYGSYIPRASFLRTVKCIITFSNNRKMLLESKLNKKVVAIGPYIHYAEPYLSEQEFLEIKGQFGRILLLFPIHATSEDKQLDFDVESLIKRVLEFKSRYGFDSVFVSMYYYDILHLTVVNQYIKAGFYIVTSGHQLDFYFISRQKSIIALADYTISNGVGTHLGYCIYMNRPHCILKSEKEKINKDLIDVEEEVAYISSFFEKYSAVITDEQRKVVAKYWGIDSIKSSDDLFQLLKNN